MRHHHWVTMPSALHQAAGALCGVPFEKRLGGVVAKRLDSPYRLASRDGSWLKAKHAHARELQVDRPEWSPRGVPIWGKAPPVRVPMN